MKKIQVLILFVFLIACSPDATLTANPLVAQSSVPIAQTLTSTSTPIPTITPTLTPFPTTTPTLVPTPIGGGSGKIAFTSEQNGEQAIYVINADGSNLVELAGDISSKFNPTWTLDGTKVSFSTATEKSASLYIMNANGSHIAKVLNTSELDAYDQIRADSKFGIGCCTSLWSPDSEKIIFKTTRGVGCCEVIGHIHILNLNNNQLFDLRVASWSSIFWSPDSTKFGYWKFEFWKTDLCGEAQLCVRSIDDAKQVTWNNVEGANFQSDLHWSPDGKKIAFASFWNSKNSDVYAMNADFSSPINISGSLVKGQNGGPVWSPDSKKVAFNSCDVYLCELYVGNAEGTEHTKLTSQILGLTNVIWSYDSKKIIYVSTESGNEDIYIVNLNDVSITNLTNNPARDYSPIFSPDGTKIAFVSDREGNDDIYILDVGNGSLFMLTKNETKDFSPVWLP